MSDSWKSASYADDFHSASQSQTRDAGSAVEERLPGSPGPEAGKTWYRYRDSATQRYICIYAPQYPDATAADDDVGETEAPAGGKVSSSRRQSARSRGSTVAAGGDTAASYSSNFDPEDSSTESASNASSSLSNASSASPASSSSAGGSGASYLRVMSIDQLTTGEDLYADEACERLTRRATLTISSSPPSPMPAQRLPPPTPQSATAVAGVEAKAVELSARALLRRLDRRRDGVPPPSETAGPRPSPYLQLVGLPASLEVPSLTVERLRVDSLRLGARLLLAGDAHEPASCSACCQERERLARADYYRDLTRRVRRDTVEKRLLEHQPACVMSREMLHVARNARLVSDWMRTGQVPETRGFS